MYQQTLQLREKVLCKEHPGTLWSKNNIADILDTHRKYKKAAQMYQQALELSEKVLGIPTHSLA
jgi:hypothetical protein